MLLVELWLYGMMVGFIAALVFQLNYAFGKFYLPETINNYIYAVCFGTSFGCALLSFSAYLALILGDPQ